MQKFHDKPIFDYYNEDVDAFYALDRKQKAPRHTFERTFTPLGFSYDMMRKTLIENNIITLQYKSRPYEPEVKPPWWRDYHFCNYHRKKIIRMNISLS